MNCAVIRVTNLPMRNGNIIASAVIIRRASLQIFLWGMETRLFLLCLLLVVSLQIFLWGMETQQFAVKIGVNSALQIFLWGMETYEFPAELQAPPRLQIFLWGMETTCPRAICSRCGQLQIFLWGMETILPIAPALRLLCYKSSYEEWKLSCWNWGSITSGVTNLPMRNGN